MPSILWLPLLSALVLPIGWLQFKALPKTRWGSLLAIPNLFALYGPWIAAIWGSRRFPSAFTAVVGSEMMAVALALWATAGPLILRVPGQLRFMPASLVTGGPYRWMRHPLYVGHVLFIGGGSLALGALAVFLETPLLWLIAALAARHEERTRLAPRFGEAFRAYQARMPFLMPAWGWGTWGLVYMGVLIQWLTT